MPVLGYFGIESSGLNLVVDLLILFVAVCYLSLIYWTYADARRRIEDPMLIGCATAASLFPFVGTIVYVILRPPEYLEDVRERELETRAAEARVRELEHSRCSYCDEVIERDFLRCPSCQRKLKERCVSCSRPLERSWTICPYCETEVATPPARRAARRRAQREAARADGAERTHRPELPEIHDGAPTAVVDEDGAAELSELTGAAATEAARASRRSSEEPAAPVAASEAARSSRGTGGSRSSRRPRPTS